MARTEAGLGDLAVPTQSMVEALFQSGGVLAGIFELEEDDYRYVLANANTAVFYGRTLEQMIGATGAELGLPADQIAGRLTFLWHCWRGGVPITTEYPFIQGDVTGWFLGTFAPVAGDTPQVSFILVDVTARRQAELEVERERRRLAAAVNAADLGLWEYDPVVDEVIWDQRTRDHFGVDVETPFNLCAYLSLVHPEDRAAALAAYQTAIQGDGSGRYSVEYRTAASEGAPRWLRGSGQVVFDSLGEPIHVFGTTQDITAEVEARERQQLLMAELNHRVKNNLATVQSLAVQTARAAPDLDGFLQTYQGRILALSRTHDVLTANAWADADLLSVATQELERLGDRAKIKGPSIRLSATRALAVGMILHELATNAAKHGSLSKPGGSVQLEWRRTSEGEVQLQWIERGGPRPVANRTPSFGMRLIQKLTAGDLRGSATYEFAETGLRFETTFPFSEALD